MAPGENEFDTPPLCCVCLACISIPLFLDANSWLASCPAHSECGFGLQALASSSDSGSPTVLWSMSFWVPCLGPTWETSGASSHHVQPHMPSWPLPGPVCFLHQPNGDFPGQGGHAKGYSALHVHTSRVSH